jgi:hypothetical protein
MSLKMSGNGKECYMYTVQLKISSLYDTLFEYTKVMNPMTDRDFGVVYTTMTVLERIKQDLDKVRPKFGGDNE